VRELRPTQQVGQVAALGDVLSHREDEQRLPAPERPSPRLAVAVPELLAPADPSQRAPPQAVQAEPERQVEPHHLVGVLEHVGADLAAVVGIEHPAVALDRRPQLRAQIGVARLGPSRAVDEGVGLDERHLEDGRQSAGQRRLAGSADALEDDPAHGR
jgi:hypothetical protein